MAGKKGKKSLKKSSQIGGVTLMTAKKR